MFKVVIPSEKRVLYFDPLGESRNNLKRCQEVTRSFMRQRGLNVSRWACNTVPHPHQKDSSSCGPFVLKFAECILKDKPISFSTNVKDVEDLRKEIAIVLLQRTDALTELCHFCGEMQNAQEDTDWIGCELCPRWFHYSCVKKPAGDTDYICDACRTD
ncbi:hypothetical protein AMEX_G13016 [Astyanax mexicanus]|uniref:PHD-type domain-containing protein n=1 Tax=Astyanax mexicanus TaxID=7994 RepID=A0A8T2LJ16_ASTMX|nr:hypothetical protein AMEX_G13016 [Astyanax mexicanus]